MYRQKNLSEQKTKTQHETVSKLTESNKNINIKESTRQYQARISESEPFWVKQLTEINPLVLPYIQTEVEGTQSSHMEETEVPDELKYDILNQLSGVTSFHDVLLMVFLVYLYRITDEEIFTIGYSYPELIKEINEGSNSVLYPIPLTVQLNDNYSFIDVWRNITKKLHDIHQHQTCPCDIFSRYPALKDSEKIWTEKPIPIIVKIVEQKFDDYQPEENQFIFMISKDGSKYRLFLNITSNEEEYQENIIDLLKRIRGHISVLLDSLSKNINQPIHKLPLLTQEEYQKIIVDFNDTMTDYPKDKTIAQIFEECVVKNKDRTALSFNDQELTYNELNEKANLLAHYLRENGVKPNTFVVIHMARCIEMIIGILAVIKAGGAYIPLNIDEPEIRIGKILTDCNPMIILTKHSFRQNLEKILCSLEVKSNLIVIDDFFTDNINCDKDVYVSTHSQQDIAYIMYTSGSTGVPKGCMINQRGIIRLVKNTNYIELCENDLIAQVSNISFDAATLEIWGAFLNGATLVIIPSDKLLSPRELINFIEHYQITVMWLTVGLFNEIVLKNADAFATLKYLLIGGDTLNPKTVNLILSNNQSPKYLVNGYGPTEGTTFTTTYKIPKHWPKNQRIPIGQPIANTRVYILDKNMQPTPTGIIGELYIGGDGVAIGYLNDIDQTKSRFVEVQFDELFEKLYKTGDLACWLPNGNIDFVGRSDNQIKIRGFRVELGEIESCINSYPSIKQALVIVKKNEFGYKKLIVYIILKDDLIFDFFDFHNFLKDNLTGYMMPSAFFKVDHFPLNSNGKVDKGKLLSTTGVNLLEQLLFEEPSDKTEEIISGIWKQVLGIEKISVVQNFFDLGAHSLLLSQACNLLNKALNGEKEISIMDILTYPTVRSLAQSIGSNFSEKHDCLSETISRAKYQRLLHEKKKKVNNGNI